MARNEFAATLTSSAVGRSVTTTGVPRRSAARTPRAAAPRRASDATPKTSRSGLQGVLDGEALAQELRVPGQLDLGAGRRELGERARRAGPRCRPAPSTCRRPGRAGAGAGRARRRRRRRSSGRRRTRPASAGCRRRRSARRRTPPPRSKEVVNRSRPRPTCLREQLRRARARRTAPAPPAARRPCPGRRRRRAPRAQLGHADGVGGAEVAGADHGQAWRPRTVAGWWSGSPSGHGGRLVDAPGGQEQVTLREALGRGRRRCCRRRRGCPSSGAW